MIRMVAKVEGECVVALGEIGPGIFARPENSHAAVFAKIVAVREVNQKIGVITDFDLIPLLQQSEQVMIVGIEAFVIIAEPDTNPWIHTVSAR